MAFAGLVDLDWQPLERPLVRPVVWLSVWTEPLRLLGLGLGVWRRMERVVRVGPLLRDALSSDHGDQHAATTRGTQPDLWDSCAGPTGRTCAGDGNRASVERSNASPDIHLGGWQDGDDAEPWRIAPTGHGKSAAVDCDSAKPVVGTTAGSDPDRALAEPPPDLGKRRRDSVDAPRSDPACPGTRGGAARVPSAHLVAEYASGGSDHSRSECGHASGLEPAAPPRGIASVTPEFAASGKQSAPPAELATTGPPTEQPAAEHQSVVATSASGE